MNNAYINIKETTNTDLFKDNESYCKVAQMTAQVVQKWIDFYYYGH